TAYACRPRPARRRAISTMASGGFSCIALCSAAEDGATVDVHDLARDVTCELAAQEDDGPGDVLLRRDAAERNRRLDALAPAARVRLRRHLRVDPAGRDAIHRHVTHGELDGDALRERDDRPLRRRVVSVTGLAALS